MTEEERKASARAAEARGWVLAMLAALVVALLVVVNVQLSEGHDAGGSPPHRLGNVPAATIPAPTTGTSNKILSEELKGVSHSLSRPIDLLREQMAPLSGLTAGQAELSKSFGNVASSLRGLHSLPVQLRKTSGSLGAVIGNTRAMVGNTRAMVGNLHDTASTLKAVERGISSTGKSTSGMVQMMKKVNQSITKSGRSTNESIVKMNEGIEAMRQSFTEINGSMATTAAGTQEMKASMVTLNANMERFLKLFCTVLTSETECPKAAE